LADFQSPQHHKREKKKKKGEGQGLSEKEERERKKGFSTLVKSKSIFSM
jgi:hypothetical protein